jgi:hypothetical protein
MSILLSDLLSDVGWTIINDEKRNCLRAVPCAMMALKMLLSRSGSPQDTLMQYQVAMNVKPATIPGPALLIITASISHPLQASACLTEYFKDALLFQFQIKIADSLCVESEGTVLSRTKSRESKATLFCGGLGVDYD